jgi:flagellar hook-associated protein 3 FlgL
MVMRLATSTMFERGVGAMLDQQSKLSRTELQLATGNRVLKPSDDPTAAARILDLNRQIETVNQHQRNIDQVRARLDLEDSTLDGAVNLLQRLRELTVQAANDTNNATNRTAISYEVGQLRDELLGLANTRDHNGEYIFSGFLGDNPAFTDVGGTVVETGDQGQRLIRISHGRQIADGDSGFEVFGNIDSGLDADGDGAVEPRRNIFNTLYLLEDILSGTPQPAPGSGNAAEDANRIDNYLREIDSAMGNILDVRARIGARINTIDEQEMVNEDFLVVMKTNRSEEKDLDYAEAVSRFQQQLTALQASQQSFSKIQNLSLFNYL